MKKDKIHVNKNKYNKHILSKNFLKKDLQRTPIELVGIGHPDIFCNYLGEKLLTEFLKRDKDAKVALEITANTKLEIIISGEVSTNKRYDIRFLKKYALKAVEELYQYELNNGLLNLNKIKVINSIKPQSKELIKIQNDGDIFISGDQGIIYGYYNPEKNSFIKRLTIIMDGLVRNFNLSKDWKLLAYTTLNKNEEITLNLNMSICGKLDKEKMFSYLKAMFDNYFQEENIKSLKIELNPKGEWLIGGFLSDTGAINRKLMASGFGAGIHHGGGGFHGKDVSKVDKYGVLLATYLSKKALDWVNEDYIEYDSIQTLLIYMIGDNLPRSTYIENNSFNQTLIEYFHYPFLNALNKYDFIWEEIIKDGGLSASIDSGYVKNFFEKVDGDIETSIIDRLFESKNNDTDR